MRTPRALVVTAAVPLLLASFVQAAAAACEPLPEPDLAAAVENQGVVGVVERETIASNPLPWGSSISVVTRIWGGIRADRWKVGSMNLHDCPDEPSHDVGTYEYDFRGVEAEWTTQSFITSDQPMAIDGVSLIIAEFGPAETFEISGVDRFMANVRMWGFELTVGLVVVVITAVKLIRRRIRRKYDRTLF
jgi:hypothetical protein